MINIKLSDDDMTKNLVIISNRLKGVLTINGGCSYVNFSSEYGHGTITGVCVSHEISALIFNVNFAQNIQFEYSDSTGEYIDMFYCLQGSLMHKLEQEENFEKINFRQNTIIKRLKSSKNVISFIPHVPLKMSFISYSLLDSRSLDSKEYRSLREMATSSLNKLNDTANYRYLGRICFRTSDYMQKLMSFSFEHASDILFNEAAILNTLASQLARYQSDTNNEHVDAPVKPYELDKILALEDFIKNNLTEKLSMQSIERISGLGPLKLQSGFKYLFDKSVNAYISEKRLEKAVELLEQREMNISEIVYQIGYSSKSYFSKIFKERYGMSPSVALKNQKVN